MKQTILDTAREMEMSLYPGQEAALRLLYGLPITDAEQIRLALKALELELEALPAPRHYRNCHILAGRRSGKSTRLVALIAIHEALRAGHAVNVDEGAYLPVIAPVESQARKTFKTIMKLLTKHFDSYVKGEPKFSAGESEIELTTGITIQVAAARANSVRGGSAVACVIEEGCHFGIEDRAAHPLSEIAGSLRPSLLTFEATGGKMIFVSSPWVKSGLMFEAWRDREQHKDYTLVLRLPSKDLNPGLSETEMFIQRKLQGDSWFNREFLSEFVDSGESMIPPEAIEAAVTRGAASFLPQEGHTYVAGFDLSARGDDSALGIAHSFEKVVSLDLCSLWKRPAGQNTIDPFLVLEQACESMAQYKVAKAYSDQVLQSVVEHTVRKAGIPYQRTITYGNGAAPMWRVVRELFVTGKVRIPDNKILIQQLKALEMKFVDGGGQHVEARRGKDDLAVAAALSIYQAYENENSGIVPFFEIVRVGGKGSGKVVPGQGVDSGWTDQKQQGDFGSGSAFPMFLGGGSEVSALGIDYQNPNSSTISVVDYLNEKKG